MSKFEADALIFGRGKGMGGMPCVNRAVSAKRANILIAAARNRGCIEKCEVVTEGRGHVNYSFYDEEDNYCWLSLNVYFLTN